MLNSIFIRNIFTIFSGLSPIFAVLIGNLSFLNHKTCFISIQTIFALMTIYILTLFPILEGQTISIVLVLYPIFVLAFNFIFFLRFGAKKFSKGLALSLMLTFVLTEMHELPVFIFSYLKLKFLHPDQVIYSIAPIYAIAVGYLATKTAKLKISRFTLLFFVLGISMLFPLYFLSPQLDISATPNILAFAKRIFCFLLLAIAFYRWSGINHANT